MNGLLVCCLVWKERKGLMIDKETDRQKGGCLGADFSSVVLFFFGEH